MSNRVTIYKVPTEAGTHWGGQYLAPEALVRKAGLQTKLRDLGYEVSDVEVLHEPALWRPAPLVNGVRNEEAALRVLDKLHACIVRGGERGAASDDLPFSIVIGGDCSLTIAALSALSEVHKTRLGVLYVDNDADLTIPAETSAPGSTGILDSMTLSNLTHRDGSLSSIQRRFKTTNDGLPPCDGTNTVLFGLDLTQPSPSHFGYLLDNHFRVFTGERVKREPRKAMEEALQTILEASRGVDKIYLHFDVDVIDSAQFPLGNYPSYGGLDFETVLSAVRYFLQCKKVVGLGITEVNPNNDPSGEMVGTLVDALVDGFRERVKIAG